MVEAVRARRVRRELQGDACERVERWRCQPSSHSTRFPLRCRQETTTHTRGGNDASQRLRSEAIAHTVAGNAVRPLRRVRGDCELQHQLARVAPEEELAMDVQVAEAVLEFGEDLRAAKAGVSTWTISQSGLD